MDVPGPVKSEGCNFAVSSIECLQPVPDIQCSSSESDDENSDFESSDSDDVSTFLYSATKSN